MLYELLKKEPATRYNNPNVEINKKLYRIIELVAETAKFNNKKYIIGGGTALAIYHDRICRKHKDFDLYVLREDFVFWEKFFEKFGLIVRKNVSNDNYSAFFQKKNKRIQRIADINFKVPNTIRDGNSIIIFKDGDNIDRFDGATIDYVPYLEKYGIKILPPEIIKEQKIGRLISAISNISKAKDNVDFRVYFDMINPLVVENT